MLFPVKNVKIEDLGAKTEWVYDLETDAHNFFANDILVHNSNYYTVEPIVAKWVKDHPDASFEEICDYCLSFENDVIVPIISKCCDDFAEQFNAPGRWAMGAKKEVLCDCVSPHTYIRWINEDGKTTLSDITDLASCANSIRSGNNCIIFDFSDQNIMTLSLNVNTNKLESKKILNIQQKLTAKKMLRIDFSTSSIECTEDHKVYIADTKQWKEAKHLSIGDAVLKDTNHTDVVTGVTEIATNDYVYDLEVEDNHNFFANGVCVHNCAIYVARKRYCARVIDDEGVRLSREMAHIKVQGLDLVRSLTPKWCKDKLKESISLLLDMKEQDLIQWLDNIKGEYTQQPLSDIAASQGVSSIEYNLGDKCLPLHVRSSLIYNKWIKDNNLVGTFNLIQSGDKPKRIFLRDGNPFNSNTVSWLDDRFTEYVKEWIDWDTSFEKFFLKPLEIMTNALGYSIENRNDSLEAW